VARSWESWLVVEQQAAPDTQAVKLVVGLPLGRQVQFGPVLVVLAQVVQARAVLIRDLLAFWKKPPNECQKAGRRKLDLVIVPVIRASTVRVKR